MDSLVKDKNTINILLEILEKLDDEKGFGLTMSHASDKQDRPFAVNTTLASDILSKKTKRRNSSLSIIGATFFMVIIGISVLAGKISPLIFALYLVASLLTFLMYAVDKSAAQKGAWRTKESTLHLLSLVGGWPGALLAQEKLRHKTKKQSFRFVFWCTVLLNCSAFVWLLTLDGANILQLLIASVL